MIKKKADGCAQFYALNLPKQTTFVMRIELKHAVDLSRLRKSLNASINLFPNFNLRLKKSFFCYKLFENNSQIYIENSNNPCFEIDFVKSYHHMIYATYFKNIIHLSFFHALTDGIGALKFTKKLIEYYFIENVDLSNQVVFSAENSYRKYKTGLSKKRDYKGIFNSCKHTNILGKHANIFTYKYRLSEMLRLAKHYNTSLTSLYLASLSLALCRDDLPISSISVPVDLRRRFKSATTNNFSASVNLDVRDINNSTTLNQAISLTSNKLSQTLEKNNLQNELNFACTLEQFPYSIIPNFIKKSLLKTDILKNSVNLSNIGKVHLESNCVQSIQFLLPAPNNIFASISMNSFKDDLYVNVSTYLSKNVFDKFNEQISTLLSST